MIGRRVGVGLLAAGLVGGGVAFGLAGPRENPRPVPAAEPASQPDGGPRARVSRDEPAVRLEWTAPAELRVNRPAAYTLTVTNTSPQPVLKVCVQVLVPDGVVASDTAPAAGNTARGVLSWTFDALKAGESRPLKMAFKAPNRGELNAQAWVTFTGTSAVTVLVKEPKLEAFIRAPESVAIGDRIPLTYGVRNPGDDAAERVVIRAAPVGVVGLVNVFSNVPPGGTGDHLPPGKDISTEVIETADRPGVIEYQVTATGADGLKSVARAQVKVLAPKLEVKVSGPAEVGIAKTATYVVTVTNTGDLTAENVTLVTDLPDHFNPALTDDPAVPWDAGGILAPGLALKPGESRKLTVAGTAMKPGEAAIKAAASEKRGAKAAGECRTVVKGIPGIRMEVVDSVDPVKTADETVYEIKVTNTGTATDRNLTLACELPPGMTLVSASGPVEHELIRDILPAAKGRDLQPGAVRFAPVRELGPKTEVVFKVKVKAATAGNARFKATLTSDHLTTPVTKEESTTVYGD